MTGNEKPDGLSRKGVKINIGSIVLIIIVINACASLRFLSKHETFPDQVLEYSKKFEKIAPLLKPGEVLGYLADNERHPIGANGKPDISSVDLVSMRQFFICQFVLAPTILVHSSEPARVVGNFSSSDAAKVELESHTLSVYQDCGNGIVLCGHSDKQ